MTRTQRLLLGLLLLLPLGCAGPDYAGGPSRDQPHGYVSPGSDVSLWRVDGFDTFSRNSEIKVAPGLHQLKIRIEFPIDNESAHPYEYRDISLRVENKHVYILRRKELEGEIDLGPPYELEISEQVIQ